MNKAELTRFIKTKARELGIARCGIAAVAEIDQDVARFRNWLDAGMNGEMDYMARRVDDRLDPRKLMATAKSVICLGQSYKSNKRQFDPEAPKISKYARGGDYHRVLRTKAKELIEEIRGQIGEFQSLISIDSNAMLEKAWAARAGIGWVGKNSLIMHRDVGSFMFLALIIVDFELHHDQPVGEECAACHVCVDACPTGAIVSPRVVNATKCIAYWTIETKGELPDEMLGQFDNWAYGCDTCQDVCPFNRRAPEHAEPQFGAKEELYKMTREEWFGLTQEKFNYLFSHTPLARGGYKRLKRNLDFLRDS